MKWRFLQLYSYGCCYRTTTNYKQWYSRKMVKINAMNTVMGI